MVNRIKELREAQKLTQEELGTLTDYDFTTVSKHETGKIALNEDAIARYCKVFKIPSHQLFTAPLEG